MKASEQLLSGWGNYPAERCEVFRPESLEALHSLIAIGTHAHYISRGLGRAYGDSALNREGGVIVHTRLNRFLAFDERTGVLECEAGVSLADIMRHLLPRGWFFPTTPGTKYVTVGGAIAADVHGKNHHISGSFGNFLLDFVLLTASGEILCCSPQKYAEVFWATVGGMGLTGIIVSARIQLVRVESAYVHLTTRRSANLDETLESFAVDRDYHYAVAWIDCLAPGQSLGRAILMLGNNAARADLPAPLAQRPFLLPRKFRYTVPFPFPSVLLNSWSMKALNALYYASHSEGLHYVDYDTFFYPLDHVLHWNRLYGRRGFVQYQALFPPETAARGLRELLEKVARSGKASFLAVLKRSGPASQGVLSYLSPGYTLALDFPNTGEDLRLLLRKLDALLLKHHGRLYMAKDTMMTADTFATMYPRLREFQTLKMQLDPNNRFVSSQARRLGIVEAA
jgi:FAD/FMN-containing dehydrogenase